MLVFACATKLEVKGGTTEIVSLELVDLVVTNGQLDCVYGPIPVLRTRAHDDVSGSIERR